MRTLKALLAALIIAVSGCKTQPTFHIVFADPCADVSIVGTRQGREYALGKPSGHDFVACYGLENSSDVGKDVPAAIDPRAGEIVLTLHGDKEVFEIEATREVSK